LQALLETSVIKACQGLSNTLEYFTVDDLSIALKSQSIINWEAVQTPITELVDKVYTQGLLSKRIDPSLQTSLLSWVSSVPKPKNQFVARPYTLPTGRTIGKTKALDLITNPSIKVFGATFKKADGSFRFIKAQFLPELNNSNNLGYYRVRDVSIAKSDTETGIRSINIQTLVELTVNGKCYEVRAK